MQSEVFVTLTPGQELRLDPQAGAPMEHEQARRCGRGRVGTGSFVGSAHGLHRVGNGARQVCLRAASGERGGHVPAARA